MSYNLLCVPEGYVTDSVLVLAPYFDPVFIKALLDTMKPPHMSVVVDDGASANEIGALSRLGTACKSFRIGVASASGLVHIKGYYLVFKATDGAKGYRRRFIFGSCNATDAAFAGNRNAELFAAVDLKWPEDKGIIEYCRAVRKAVRDGNGAVQATVGLALARHPTLFLPGFRVSAVGEIPGFDAWLQLGILAARYRDQQGFMRLGIKLKKNLPQGRTARNLAAQDLVPDGRRDTLRYAYIGESSEASAKPKWKARYTLWTHFGDWMSDACFRAKRGDMVLGSTEQRRSRVDELRKYGRAGPWRHERGEGFAGAIERGWRAIKISGGDPAEYFAVRKGRADTVTYKEALLNKIDADLGLAEDREFYARYVTGFEFSRVPRFRPDAEAWDAFVLSWCESLAVELKRDGTKSLIAKAMRSRLSTRSARADRFEPLTLAARLRSEWGELEQDLAGYHDYGG